MRKKPLTLFEKGSIFTYKIKRKNGGRRPLPSCQIQEDSYMKKALVLLLVLAVAGGVFGQDFNIQGRIDGIWIPFQYVSDGNADNSMIGAGMGRDTNGGAGVRARFFGSGSNEAGTAGISIQLQFFPFAGGLGFDDNVKFWWQPNPEFRFVLGRMVEDQLMGNQWDFWLRRYTVGSYNASVHIFERFQSDAGALFLFTPGDLTIGVHFKNSTAAFHPGPSLYYETTIWPGASQSSIVPNFADGANEFGRFIQRTQVSVGYRIADIGLIRAQFVGANPGVDEAQIEQRGSAAITAMRIEAAFRFLAVDGLDLDVGFKFPLPFDESAVKAWNEADAKWESPTGGAVRAGTYKAPMTLGVGLIYNMGDFRINGNITSNFGGGIDYEGGDSYSMGPDFNVHFWPSYNFGRVGDLGTLRLGVDFGVWWKGNAEVKTGTTTTTIENGIMAGGGIWGDLAIGNGNLRTGLAFSAPTKIRRVGNEDYKSWTTFTIPIFWEMNL